MDVLPRIFPEIKPVHFALDPTEAVLDMLDPEGLSRLPEIVHGVSIEDILGYISAGIPIVAGDDGQPDRISAANGQCTTTSLTCLRQLLQGHESLRPFALTKRIEPAFRRSFPGEYFYPRLTPLSYGHTIIGIPYKAGSTPMELLIDATIAQTDRTQKYDIAVVAVPQAQVPNYLRLRYSSYPNGSVHTTIGPPK